MSKASEIIIFIVVFFVSYLGVEFFRRWSRRRGFFDVPNERSSHSTPIPRGGGLVIAAVCLICYTFYTIFSSGNFQWSYPAGAGLIAVVSWFDDIFDVSFVWRFAAQSFAALLLISMLGFFEDFYIPAIGRIELGIIGPVLTFLWIVWLTNAYNFMDGIDGIAGMQAVAAGIGWLLAGRILGFADIEFYGGVIAASSFGFLIHNWQPAKIFMGDVGSAFLGYTFAVLPLLAKGGGAEKTARLPLVAVALVFPFVFDTVLTFFRRLFKKEKIWRAHRSHIYQKLVISGFSHRSVALVYGFISLMMLGLIVFWLRN